MKVHKRKAIGIIGGMGPQASCELYRLLIEGARFHYGVRNNDEYPEILIDSVPVPDFLSDTRHMQKAYTMLRQRVCQLSNMGVGYITFACNTACVFYPNLSKITQGTLVSIIDETATVVEKRNHARVLILASPTTLRLRLYHNAFEQSRVPFVTPDPSRYHVLAEIIRGVLAGKDLKNLSKQLVFLVGSLRKKYDFDGIVLGCTELPLVFPANYDLPVYDSLSILAKALLKQYYKKTV